MSELDDVRERLNARITAIEAELSRLKAPMEGAKVSAEERAACRNRVGRGKRFEAITVARLLDDLDHATAQARSAADDERVMDQLYAIVKRYRFETPLGHQPHMISSEVEKVLGQVEAIRARRKGETG